MVGVRDAPRWLSRLSVVALGLLVLGFMIGPLAVLVGASIGAARETPWRTVEPPLPVELAPGEQRTFGPPLVLGSPSTALIVEAQFDLDADPLAWWGVVCQVGDGLTVTYRLAADGYFSIPPLAPDSRAFLHIRPPGQPNRLMIQRGGAHLRINEEIAWDGTPPTLHTCQLAAGTVDQSARLVVSNISVR